MKQKPIVSKGVTHVVDASALLCLFFSESGADRVAAIIDGAALSTVNYAEILSKLIERGLNRGDAVAKVEKLPLLLIPLDSDLAEVAAGLRPATRGAGLSLGDRCCLALALRYGAVAVTTDRAWGRLDPALGLTVLLVR